MSRMSLCVLFAASAFAVSAADLDEYVQPDLVAMWDGYRNQGADKPHDSTATVWYDTTGQYGFVLNGGATMGDDCCKFAFYGGNTSYGTLSAEDTAATFDLAKDGTMEIVFYQLYDGNAVLLQSSGTSGIAFGRNAASSIITSNTSGSPTGTYAPLNKFSSIAVTYANGKSVASYANGEVLTLSSANNYGGATTETFIGNRAAKNGAFNGYIHAIRLYSRQLTPEEIAQNAAVDRERYFNRKPEATASYPAFDGMAGVTVDKTFTVGADLTVNAAHAAAVEYLAANDGATAAVFVPEGTYALTEPILLVKGEKLVGAGRDKTFLDCIAPEVSDAEYAVKVSNDDNLVRGITLFHMVEITKAGTQPHAFYVTKGVVDNCRSTLHRSQYGSFGVALYQLGGTVTNCLLDHVSLTDMSVNGLIARVNGGLIVASDICYNDDGIGRSFTAGGLYLGGADAIARNCRIHDCGKSRNYEDEQGAGVYIANGTLENSLIYNNLTCNSAMSSAKAAGVRVAGGTMRYCTIVNNQTVNDAVGYSGLVQSAGTVQNCIIVDNWSPTLGANVTGGTFEKNLVNKAVTGKDDNFVTSDARFVDEGAADFHIAVKASAAVGKAVPVADVVTDFDGTARDAEAPTIGAFEFVAQAAEFTAEVLVTQKDWRKGSSPTAELVYDGVTDLSKLSVTWYLNGEEVAEAKDAVKPAFEGLALGRYDLKAVATYDGQTKEPDEIKEAYRVVPPTVYVNGTGNGTFPFATPETATNVLAVAYDALWKSTSETTTVEIAAGEYPLGAVLNVDSPVVFEGAGREATTVTGIGTTVRLVTLKSDGAVVRNLTLNGCGEACGGGVEIANGLVENCQITNCLSTTVGLYGVGVKVGAGAIWDCEIVDCHGLMSGGGSMGYGGGVAIVGKGVVRDCQIRRCWISGWGGGTAIAGGNGSGLYASAGLIENCVISDCGDHLRPHQSSDFPAYCAVCLANGDGATLRNALIVGNVSEKLPVFSVAAGKAENVTVTGNVTPDGVTACLCKPGNLNQSFYDAMMTNCVMWGNSGLDFEAKQGVYSNTTTSVVTTHDPKVGYCCYPTAEEGVDGNTAKDPKFRGGANKGLGVISSNGSCFRTGAVQPWMEGATDLKGHPRLTDGAVDRGCYQVGFDPGLMLLAK